MAQPDRRLQAQRLGLILAASALGLLLPSCYQARDALVFNPCDEPATVLLSSRPSPPRRQGEWNATVRVAAISPARVEDAFTEPPEEGTSYTAEVRFVGEPAQLLSIPASAEEPQPVLIPASFCPATIVGDADLIVFLSPDSGQKPLAPIIDIARRDERTACIELLDPKEQRASLEEGGIFLEDLGISGQEIGWAVKIALTPAIAGARRVRVAEGMTAKLEAVPGVHRVFLSGKGILPEHFREPRCA